MLAEEEDRDVGANAILMRKPPSPSTANSLCRSNTHLSDPSSSSSSSSSPSALPLCLCLCLWELMATGFELHQFSFPFVLRDMSAHILFFLASSASSSSSSCRFTSAQKALQCSSFLGSKLHWIRNGYNLSSSFKNSLSFNSWKRPGSAASSCSAHLFSSFLLSLFVPIILHYISSMLPVMHCCKLFLRSLCVLVVSYMILFMLILCI